MYEHQQIGCKRRKKHLRKLSVLLTVCLIIGTVFMSVYYRRWKTEIHIQQEWLDSVLIREKKWILQNQGSEGEIYMNGSKAGDINPYFACVAAVGLLAETENCPVSEEEIDAVRRYLNWHTRILRETDGKMGIYRKKSGKIVYVDKADSEDGYLGMYLWLMGKYLKKAGNAEKPEYYQEGIRIALDRIQNLMKNGTTQVSEENTTVYLMDNLEVWKGLYEFESSDSAEKNEVSVMCKDLQKQIEKVFWDEQRKRWKILQDSEQLHPEEFYPDAIAQIYPLIYGFPIKDKKEQKKLYQWFTEKFQWQTMNKQRKGFVWTMTGMAAAQLGDINNLRSLIKNYEAEYSSIRKYPLYTGEAGWICQECEKLYQLYEDSYLFFLPQLIQAKNKSTC